jgi:hypothetical protein
LSIHFFKSVTVRAEKTRNRIGGKKMGKEGKEKQAERKALKRTASYLKKGPKGKSK